MAKQLDTMAQNLVAVREALRDALGDHMVASTVFAKRFPTIYREIAKGASPYMVARSLWDTDFAGCDGYESA